MDMIADFCTRIRNAFALKKRMVDIPHSKYKEAVANVLLKERYIKSFQVFENEGVGKTLRLFLSYVNGSSVISRIDSVSTSGRRCFVGKSDLKPVLQGLGMHILSTNKGVMSSREARKLEVAGHKGVGGEVLCVIW